jgi:hypothetical protein
VYFSRTTRRHTPQDRTLLRPRNEGLKPSQAIQGLHTAALQNHGKVPAAATLHPVVIYLLTVQTTRMSIETTIGSAQAYRHAAERNAETSLSVQKSILSHRGDSSYQTLTFQHGSHGAPIY